MLRGVVVMVTVVIGLAAAFPPMYNWQLTSQFPRLFQAACLVKNTATGQELVNSGCTCGGVTGTCDLGPVVYYGMEITFCNKLANQTTADLFIMQFACQSGVDANCGPGTYCDMGPLTIDGVQYYLCRISQSVATTTDTTSMCKPAAGLTQPPMLGLGMPYGGRGRRWGASSMWGQGVMPAYPSQPVQPVQPFQPVNTAQTLPTGTQQVLPAYQGMAGGAWMGGPGRRGGLRYW